MSATGNTTPLMDDQANGTIGTRNFSDYGAKQISTEVSRRNYRQGIKSDAELDEFRQIVYKMVSGWAMEDKIAQITEYGDASQLQKYRNPSDEVINKILTESIIIHLNPEDLRRLRLDMGQKANKVRKGIERANKNADRIRKGFNTATFGDAAAATSGAKNANEFRKKMKDFDPSYRVPKYIERQYGRLRKELLEVLTDCFNKVELTGIADSMGIEIPQKGNQFKELTKSIINKVCLYVDLIVGKGKANYGNAIMDPEPYNKILKYTSYSYITGEPGLDPNAWAELKKNARRAKKEIKERAKRQFVKDFKGNTKSMAHVTGGKRAKTLGGLARQLKNGDTGVLADASFEELVELAGRYGIDPTAKQNKNINILKAKIYNGMRNDYERVTKLNKRKNRLISTNRGGKELRDIDDILSIYNDKKKKNNDSSSDTKSDSPDIPILEFHSSGKLKTKSVLKAIPVWLVGQGLPGENLTEDEKKIKNAKNKLIGGKTSLLASKSKDVDTSIKSKSDLSDEELQVFNYIMSLEYKSSRSDPSGGKKEFSTPTSLFEMDSFIDNFDSKLKYKIWGDVYGYSQSGFNKTPIDINIDQNAGKLFEMRLRYAYVWGMIKKYKKLCSYLTNKYGIMYKRTQAVKRFFKGLGRGIANALILPGLIIGAVKGIKKIVDILGKHIYDMRFPTDPTQLGEKARGIYNQLANETVASLVTLIKNTGFSYNEDLLNKFKFNATVKDSVKIPFLKAVYAKLISEMQLSNLYLFEAGIFALDTTGKKHKKVKGPNHYLYATFKEITKRNIFRMTVAAFKRIGRGIRDLFKTTNHGKTMDGGTDVGDESGVSNTTAEDSSFNPSLAIPKIKYLGSGSVDEAKIEEVVPVYVVNMKGPDVSKNEEGTQANYVARPWGSGGDNAANHGETNRDLTLKDYAKVFGADTVDEEKFLIKLKNKDDKSVAEEANKAVNRDASDDTMFGRRKGWYIPTKETIAWAIRNNKQFATGGTTYSDTFITGDARGNNIFAGGAKPELIQTFSKTPVLSRITPIKKFAEGGVSNSVPFLNPKKLMENSMATAEKILEEIQARASVAETLQGLGAEVPDDIQTMKPKKLASSLKKAVKGYNQEQKEKKKAKGKKAASEGASASKLSADAESIGIKKIDTKVPAMPVFITNEFANGNDLIGKLDDVATSITDNFASLMQAMSVPMVVSAPYGAGSAQFPGFMSMGTVTNVATQIAKGIDMGAEIAQQALEGVFNTGGTIKRAYTGGKIPRFVTGGATSSSKIITGDSAGKNIFSGGAKPELVKSNGDMEVIPLNKGGDANKVKIDRMTPEERRDALATSIASHVIKFSYPIPDGSSEVSNVGEAIKVFNVKPGITDTIDINGTKTSLIDILGAIQGELAGLIVASNTSNELLTALAKLSSAHAGGGSKSAAVETNPFAGGFPSSMNGILGGR